MLGSATRSVIHLGVGVLPERGEADDGGELTVDGEPELDEIAKSLETHLGVVFKVGNNVSREEALVCGLEGLWEIPVE
jgi:hypothetical protein